MKIEEFITAFNGNNPDISYNRFQHSKQYYMSMYRYWMFRLYDDGYIGDPTAFDKVTLSKEIEEELIPGFVDRSGKYHITSERAYFSSCCLRGTDKYIFVNMLYQALRYREYWVELDKCYEMYNSRVSNPYSLYAKYGSLITSRTNLDVNKAIFTTLIDEESKIVVENFNEDVYMLGCKSLGITEMEDGMFIKGMSYDDEVANCRLIFNGLVTCDGKYATLLDGWLANHSSTEYAGLYDWVFLEYKDTINDVFEKIIKGKEVVGAYGSNIYIRSDIDGHYVPVGEFVIYTSAQHPDCVIEDYNSLYGYAGECYSLSWLKEEGMYAVGIPLIINYNGIEIEVYDREQLNNFKQESWFIQSGVVFDYEELLQENPYAVGTIQYELYNAYKYGMRGGLYKVQNYTLEEIDAYRKQVTNRIVKSSKLKR